MNSRPPIKRVRICCRDQDQLLAPLRQRCPEIEFRLGPLPDRDARQRSGQALISFEPPADESPERYSWVHVSGAGVDRVSRWLDHSGAAPIVTRTIGSMGRQMGEYCLAYALEHLQRLRRRRDAQAHREWTEHRGLAQNLFEHNVLIVGCGPIAQGIASCFKPLARQVYGAATHGREVAPFDEVVALDQLTTAMCDAAIVILALPASARTIALIDDALLGRLRGALLINVGRGATLDDAALRRALDKGAISNAVLDVFAQEPLPESAWQWSHPQVTVTAHLSGPTRVVDVVDAFAANLALWNSGRPLINQVEISTD